MLAYRDATINRTINVIDSGPAVLGFELDDGVLLGGIEELAGTLRLIVILYVVSVFSSPITTISNVLVPTFS